MSPWRRFHTRRRLAAALVVLLTACAPVTAPVAADRPLGLHLTARVEGPADAARIHTTVEAVRAGDDVYVLRVRADGPPGLRVAPNLGELGGLPLRAGGGVLTLRRGGACQRVPACRSAPHALLVDTSAAAPGTYRVAVPVTWRAPGSNGQAVLDVRLRVAPVG